MHAGLMGSPLYRTICTWPGHTLNAVGPCRKWRPSAGTRLQPLHNGTTRMKHVGAVACSIQIPYALLKCRVTAAYLYMEMNKWIVLLKWARELPLTHVQWLKTFGTKYRLLFHHWLLRHQERWVPLCNGKSYSFLLLVKLEPSHRAFTYF